MKKRVYIAYGSNLNVQQMRWRCPTARIIGTGEVPDHRLVFKGSRSGSYLTIDPWEGASVPVAAWEVTEQDELALDRYEGYPDFYHKVEMTLPIRGIRSGRARRRRVFVYRMREDAPYGLPTDRYVATCREGYEAFRFDSQKLTEALLASAMEVTG